MRKIVTVIVLVLMVSLLSSCCKVGVRDIKMADAPQMKLYEKAEHFENELEDHTSPEGLFWYRLSKKGDCYVVAYSALSDAAYMTGWLVEAEALRYKVTANPAAKENVKRLVHGLHFLQEVTGIEGYFARAFCKKEVARPESWFDAVDNYNDYVYKGNTSKDQYTPVMFGYSLAYDVVKDDPEMEETKNLIVGDVSRIGDHLIDNNYQIIGEQGPTKDGDLSVRMYGLAIGLNALHRLTWIKIAEEITGEDRFKEAYDKLIAEGCHKIVASPFSFYDRPWPFRCPDYVNNNMTFLNLYSILRIETDEEEYYRKALNNRFFWKKSTQYPFWNFVYAGFCQNTRKRETAVKQGKEGLLKLPLAPGKFWGIIQREGVKYAGTAFLAAYWVGRSHGLISEQE